MGAHDRCIVRYIGRYSTRYRSGIDRVLVDARFSIGRVSTEYWSMLGLVSVDTSVEYRPMYILERLSTGQDRSINALVSVDM